MRVLLLLAVNIVAASAVARADPPPSPRMTALADKLAAHERGAEDSFWRQLATEGTPIFEDVHEPGRVLVTFVWRGKPDTQHVAVIGPVMSPSPEADLLRVPGSNVFARSLLLPESARFNYFFVVDHDAAKHGSSLAESAHHDPLNRHPFSPIDSVGVSPRAPAQSWLVAHRGASVGAVWHHALRAATPEQERQLFVYTPPGYTTTGPAYPLLVEFDAEAVTGLVPLPLILDELIAAKKIPPVVALFIGNIDRTKDLSANPAFADVVALDLVPWMRDRYHATTDPRRTVISGISLGGLAAAYVASRHPETFSNVLSQSGSFWWGPDGAEPEATARELATSAKLPLRFWTEVGTLEVGGKDTTMLAANRHLRDVLTLRGYDVSFHEFAGNHTYAAWRGTIADGLIALFGTPPKVAAARVARGAKRTPLDVAPATRSSVFWLLHVALVDGGEAAVAAAKQLSTANPDSYVVDEHEVDTAGITALLLDRPRDALALLRWNAERFPNSANAWDDVAWTYLVMGDRVRAIENFKRELALDPKNAAVATFVTDLAALPSP